LKKPSREWAGAGRISAGLKHDREKSKSMGGKRVFRRYKKKEDNEGGAIEMGVGGISRLREQADLLIDRRGGEGGPAL